MRFRFVILWMIGEKKIESIDNLVQDIQKSQNFTKSSINRDNVHELTTVETAEKVKEWIESNQELIRRQDIRFKVITLWKIKDNQTAVDVIRAVRSELPRAPILIFTNKQEETQPALEFPNVMVTDAEFELKEFVGVYQETQWNPGCQVSSQWQTTLSTPDKYHKNI
jgi:hypothetical protein